MPSRTIKGFTLIELSIVIVIIGLIVAGVVGGQSLVKQAKLRGVISELNQFKIQFSAFKLEYDDIPGDMQNATSYWPGCNSGATDAQCNGNGDNRVRHHPTDVNDNESFRLWQHIQLAGLSNGQLTGVGRQDRCNLGGCYTSKNVNGVFHVDDSPNIHSYRSPTISNNNLLFLTSSGQPNFWYPVFTVPEAFGLDQKIDDGVANTGSFLAVHHNSFGAGGCSAGHVTVGGADYIAANLGDKDNKRCIVSYMLR